MSYFLGSTLNYLANTAVVYLKTLSAAVPTHSLETALHTKSSQPVVHVHF